MAYTAWSVVYGEQPSAAKWNILGTNDASFNDGSGIANATIKPNHLFASASVLNTWAWDTYTPTFANTTLGNGTVAGAYQKIGKTVLFRASFILGSTSAVGTTPSVSYPVASVATTAGWGGAMPIGNVVILDGGVTSYFGVLYWTNTTTANLTVGITSGPYMQNGGLTATLPITFGTSDALLVTGAYEAA